MKKYLLGSIVVGIACIFIPVSADAAIIDNFLGSDVVYMDYKNGADEVLVKNFTSDETISWDTYSSAEATQHDSWDFVRTYEGEDFADKNDEWLYGLFGGRATRFDGAWYFIVSASSLTEFSLVPHEVQIWRITKRGGKPEIVFRIATDAYYSGGHSPLAKLDDHLVFLDPLGNMYRTANGENWSFTHVPQPIEDAGGLWNDFVTDGKKAFLSVGEDVFRSSDGYTWKALGTPCVSDASCTVSSLQPRPKKGVFAVVDVYSETASFSIWTYKKGEWSQSMASENPIASFEAFADHAVFLQYRDNSGYAYVVKRLLPNGTIERLTKTRSGTPLAVFSPEMSLVVFTDSIYVTLVTQ